MVLPVGQVVGEDPTSQPASSLEESGVATTLMPSLTGALRRNVILGVIYRSLGELLFSPVAIFL